MITNKDDDSPIRKKKEKKDDNDDDSERGTEVLGGCSRVRGVGNHRAKEVNWTMKTIILWKQSSLEESSMKTILLWRHYPLNKNKIDNNNDQLHPGTKWPKAAMEEGGMKRHQLIRCNGKFSRKKRSILTEISNQICLYEMIRGQRIMQAKIQLNTQRLEEDLMSGGSSWLLRWWWLINDHYVNLTQTTIMV